jgi:L-ascorbate metabolism protein UlaG (beta-lactamase superfamily)
MNTHHDEHALSHEHRANPVTVVRAAIAASEDSLLHSMDLHEDIQHLAYHLWDAAGKPVGDGVHFWLKAEQALAENAKALNRGVDSHYRDNNRMFQRHGDRGHRRGIKTK